jgi:hypothetical protein
MKKIGYSSAEIIRKLRQARDLRARGSPPPIPATETAPDAIPRRSPVGLNAASLFPAEITDVVMPFPGARLLSLISCSLQ